MYDKMNDDDQSQMFKVDHTEEHEVTEDREKHFFDKDKVIIQPGQKRKVIYGTLDEEERTVYQILQPYLWKMAESTGGIASKVGQGIYNALCTGAGWAYDKFINSVIPYTKEQIPKMLFVVTKKENKQNYQSDSFQVIEVDDPEYDAIKKNQKKKKKRVIVPLDKEADPALLKLMEEENYVQSTDFPIDYQSKQSESFLIPSASFVCLHDQITKGLKQNNQTELSTIKENEEKEEEEKKEENKQEKKEEKQINYPYKMVENQKTVHKLKDCYIFEYEGENSIEYDLLDGIEKHEKTQTGYLLFPEAVLKKVNSEGSDKPESGETPLLVAKEENVTQVGKKVKVEIPTNIKYVKEEEKEKELAYS